MAVIRMLKPRVSRLKQLAFSDAVVSPYDLVYQDFKLVLAVALKAIIKGDFKTDFDTDDEDAVQVTVIAKHHKASTDFVPDLDEEPSARDYSENFDNEELELSNAVLNQLKKAFSQNGKPYAADYLGKVSDAKLEIGLFVKDALVARVEVRVKSYVKSEGVKLYVDYKADSAFNVE